MLYEELINFDVDVKSSEEVIKFNSKVLIENGFVLEGYDEMVVEREKVYPTGLIATGRGIAIPHTNPDLVLKQAICVVIPKQPIDFIMMGTPDQIVKAEVIFPLVIKNPDSQLSLLRKIVEMLQNDELIEEIYHCRDKKQIIKLLSFFEE
ncbi:MAG: PTS sugar transporter subunit IIA [Erysipelotrichaceae bacterium]